MYFDPYKNVLAIFPISRGFPCTYVQTVYVLSPLEVIGEVGRGDSKRKILQFSALVHECFCEESLLFCRLYPVVLTSLAVLVSQPRT